jgi:biopolymer transport protein ExbB/TolQ
MEFNIASLWTQMSLPVKLTAAFMGVLSVFSIYVIIERFLTFRAGATQNISYVLALRDYLTKRKVDDALKAAQLHTKSPVARVVESGLKALKSGRDALEHEGPDDVGDFDLVDSVNRALDRVKDRETSSLRKGLGGLASVASVTPFVGLFGTVLGIINAFGLLKHGGTIDTVGPAIAEALISTAFGLLVAIPAAMFFNYYTTRVENMVVDMNDVASEFVDFVLREGRS